jgi:hypothetical protein
MKTKMEAAGTSFEEILKGRVLLAEQSAAK